MKELRLPADTVKAIFCYLGPRKRFPADIQKIHKAFYDLSQDKRFSGLFSGFIFDTSRTSPYSVTVCCAMDRLQRANFLTRIKPGTGEFEISEALIQDDWKRLNLFNEEEERLLKEAATDFGRLIQT